jgi:hypothetical protein
MNAADQLANAARSLCDRVEIGDRMAVVAALRECRKTLAIYLNTRNAPYRRDYGQINALQGGRP